MRCQAQFQRTHESARKALKQLQAEREAYEREHLPVLGRRLQVLRLAPNEPKLIRHMPFLRRVPHLLQ